MNSVGATCNVSANLWLVTSCGTATLCGDGGFLANQRASWTPTDGQLYQCWHQADDDSSICQTSLGLSCFLSVPNLLSLISIFLLSQPKRSIQHPLPQLILSIQPLVQLLDPSSPRFQDSLSQSWCLPPVSFSRSTSIKPFFSIEIVKWESTWVLQAIAPWLTTSIG
jgi:hypothetical protein